MPKDKAIAVLLGARQVLDDIATAAQDAAGGLTRVQLRCLGAVSEADGMRLGDLADVLGVNPSTALRTIDRLIESKFVRRRENPEDRREVQLTITKRGLEAVEASVAARREAIAAILNRMPVEHRWQLLESVQSFLDAAGAEPGHVTPAPSEVPAS